MKTKEILNRIHDFLGKVVRDCPDQDMGLEASNLADDVWDVLHAPPRNCDAHAADPDWKDTCAKCKEGDIEPEHCEYYGEPNGCNSPIYGEHPTKEGGTNDTNC